MTHLGVGDRDAVDGSCVADHGRSTANGTAQLNAEGSTPVTSLDVLGGPHRTLSVHCPLSAGKPGTGPSTYRRGDGLLLC